MRTEVAVLPCPAWHQTAVTGTCPALLSLIPDWDWCQWELSAVRAPGAGVTTHVLGTCRGTPHSCSPDELCQLPGLHQAVGQVGVLVPAVLGVKLERPGKQRGCDCLTNTCPAPKLPANPPNPSKHLCLHVTPTGDSLGCSSQCTARLWVTAPCPKQYFIKSVHSPGQRADSSG